MNILHGQVLDTPSIEVRVSELGASRDSVSAAGAKGKEILTDLFPNFSLEQYTNRSLSFKTEVARTSRPSANIEFSEIIRTRMSLAHARKAAIAALHAAEQARAQANLRDSEIAASINDDLYGS